jgi:hypothetical protein
MKTKLLILLALPLLSFNCSPDEQELGWLPTNSNAIEQKRICVTDFGD